MNIINIENRFKEITNLPIKTNLSVWPLTNHIGFEIRKSEKKLNGEVFTPLELVDKMLKISSPIPSKFNMDLCAGYGQFTIRILRMFVNKYKEFNIKNYLENYHWFNEFNENSAEKLKYIFGKNINLAIGDAQKLNLYPEDSQNIWLKGTFYFNENKQIWENKKEKKLKENQLF